MTIPRGLFTGALIAAAVAAVAFLALGPVLQIRAVSVVGYRGPEAPAVRDAFAKIVKTGTALRGADASVRQYASMIPAISDVRIERTSMFSTRITLVVRNPVAAMHGMGAPHVVSADGTVVPSGRNLATVNGKGATDAQRHQLIAVAAALPMSTRSAVRALEMHRGAMRARLVSGTPIRLGAARSGQAKGVALGHVLTSVGARARAAAYIDVSVPQRVVLGPPRTE